MFASLISYLPGMAGVGVCSTPAAAAEKTVKGSDSACDLPSYKDEDEIVRDIAGLETTKDLAEY
ncbi:hypothetical protein HK104_005760, partial [Borealophlyctis nickersoniae]